MYLTYNTQDINSSPPSATYMHHWTESPLVQVMAWCQPDLLSNRPNKLQSNSIQNTTIFIHGNAFQNVVCPMAAILSRKRGVKCCCLTWYKSHLNSLQGYNYLEYFSGFRNKARHINTEMELGESIPRNILLSWFVFGTTRNCRSVIY